jgi:hypothetical protein
MTSSCGRCVGYVIGERDPDYYQARCWRCINCGWYREDAAVRPSRAISLFKRGTYQLRG